MDHEGFFKMAATYRSTKDETVRLFEHDFMEFFTRVHPSVPLILYLPPILLFLSRGLVLHALSPLQVLEFFVLGCFLWTGTEYFLHRFFFHYKAKGESSRKFFYLIHGIHHDYPNDSKRLVMPPVVSLPIALPLILSSWGHPVGEVLVAGFGFGYLSYDMIHYAVHHFPLRGPIAGSLKQYHLRHHFQDAERGFGVSSPLWDSFFGTLLGKKGISQSSLVVVFLAVFYCATHAFFGHLKPIHFVFSGFVLFLYFFHEKTRLFAFLAIPFVVKEILFDYLRYIPFDWIKPVHVTEPYLLERILFGFLPHEVLLRHLHPLLDLFSGLIYFLNEPVAVAMVLLLWILRSEEFSQRYASAYLLMNLFAFATYVFYPAAAPWYVAKYGFLQPAHLVPGDPAGLANFDRLLGLHLSSGFYGMSPFVFGALPSMHAGFSVLCWLYSFRLGGKWAAAFGVYALSMCFSAVYLQHHYVIDLILGIFYALIAWGLIEGILRGAVKKIYKSLHGLLIQDAGRPLLSGRVSISNLPSSS